MVLLYLTIAAAAVLVLVLAGYLIAIAWALMRARRNVAELATTLEAIAEATSALPGAIEETDAAVAQIAAAIPGEEGEAVDIATPADRHVSSANV